MERQMIYGQLHTIEGIASLLALDDFSAVYREADRVRQDHVGDVVHLRAIIEFSNVCKRQCLYCGLNRENKQLTRCRMNRQEILDTAKEAVSAGYRTIVLQSGEDDYFTAERLGEIVEDIKRLTIPSEKSMASGGEAALWERGQIPPQQEPSHPSVTVSCGEKTEAELRHLKAKGADRYLLKHETADPVLYDRLHPCGTLAERAGCLKTIRRLGYETGSGFMIGLPGQTLETIARDLLFLKEIPCHMAGIGPFIANPKTPLGNAGNGDPELTRRAVALARLLLPQANLPLTTALAILNGEKEGNPFAFGANVIMKKVTPDRYKAAYEIYPAQFKKTHIAADRRELEQTIRHFGRTPL